MLPLVVVSHFAALMLDAAYRDGLVASGSALFLHA